MDVLVSIGTSASYFFSMLSILHHHIMVRFPIYVQANAYIVVEEIAGSLSIAASLHSETGSSHLLLFWS